MERLTKRIEDENTLLTEVGDTACKCFCDNYTLSGCWECPVGKAIEKLAEYEDLEEQDLLVRLPDDLNRVLYQINYRWTECTEYGEENNKCEIYDCKCECDSKKEYYITEVGFQYISTGNYYDRLGKTIFLTREEAKKKLEEMKNDKA